MDVSIKPGTKHHRDLLVHGEFWYPRFPHLRAVVPDRALLVWPHFLINDHWCEVSDLR